MKGAAAFSTPITVAHRGASGRAPENTLVAMELAKESGACWVEIDFMMLGDGEIIAMHDTTLDRTTNGKGAVVDHTYQDVSSLNAGAWFAPEFAHEPIPTLSQCLETAARLELNFIIELKSNGAPYEKFIHEVMDLAEPYWDPQTLHPIFFSEQVEILKLVRQRLPQAIVGQVVDEWQDEIFEEFLARKFDIFCINKNELNKKRLKLLHDAHVSIAVYTINDPEDYEELAHLGIDYLITDYPEFERALIK